MEALIRSRNFAEGTFAAIITELVAIDLLQLWKIKGKIQHTGT